MDDKKPFMVAYICDKKTCGDVCPNDMCHHVLDITHAANFECINPDSDEKIYFEKEKKEMIKDSGARVEFETGAVRDIREGKGRCDLMPLDVLADCFSGVDEESYYVLRALNNFKENHDTSFLYSILVHQACNREKGVLAEMFLDVAHHFEEGAKKYGENNWQKGIPVHCYLDSAVRHYLKQVRGDEDELHYRAFVWNVLCCIWTCEHHPELIDI